MMQRPNVPTVLVIFGATGDLMSKKIVPALYHLFTHNQLPKLFRVLGVARRPLTTPEFRDTVRSTLLEHLGREATGDQLKAFLNRFDYQSGQFAHLKDYRSLARRLGHIDGEWRACSNKLFYLAVPPELYATIFQHLAKSNLTLPCSPDEGWTRVIVEKPFGRDQKTAKRLDTLLGKLFREEQIYRIDHYLAKEMLQNILTFRFSNNLLEESWNNRFIERIDIRLLEEQGVEDRGAFYDGVGALRDVGQNHLLQMLALVTMDNPRTLTAESIRRERSHVLASLRRLERSEIERHSFRGQYHGYRSIAQVAPRSTTETYFAVRTFIDNPRWQGVPIYLESGKKLAEKLKEIVVTFKHPSPCLCPAGRHFQNTVRFTLEPTEGIQITFWAKQPGLALDIEERSLNFRLSGRRPAKQDVEAYGKLLLDCFAGDQTLFVSTQEIQLMWQAIDPIMQAWQKNYVPLEEYQPGDPTLRQTAAGSLDYEPVDRTRRTRELGIVGLGKMGSNLARQLLEKNWRVVGYNRTQEVTKDLASEGLSPVFQIHELIHHLAPPRIIWLMLPAGTLIDDILFGESGLAKLLERGDIVIDGANSFYKDAIRRARRLRARGIRFVDVGVSGGPGGARTGASLMIGGDQTTFDELLPLFLDIAIPGGVAFFDGPGAGHFVKMVHNGIEYGMMQALAEGFTILKASPYQLDLGRVTDSYNHGSVIESRLIGWLKQAFERHGENLDGVTGSVAHTGEGAWTVATAQTLHLAATIIEASLNFRKRSSKQPSYTGKILSALREQFGGHAIKEDT